MIFPELVCRSFSDVIQTRINTCKISVKLILKNDLKNRIVEFLSMFTWNLEQARDFNGVLIRRISKLNGEDCLFRFASHSGNHYDAAMR